MAEERLNGRFCRREIEGQEEEHEAETIKEGE